MPSLREFGWLSGSLAVHALVLVSALVAKLTAAPEFVQRQETPEGVAVEFAAVDLTDAPTFVAEETPTQAPASPLRDEAEPHPVAAREPAVPAARSPSPPPAQRSVTPKVRPRPTPVAEGEDWLGVAEPLPTTTPSASEPKKPPEDPWVARLLAAERRKRADRERSTLPPTVAPAAAPGAAIPLSSVAAADITPAGVANAEPRNLATAFTRAITQAEMANPLWETLPLGSVGSVRVVLRLSAGSLEDPEFVGAPKLSLRKLSEKALRLLRNGRFALPFAATDAHSGAQRFDVEVTLSQRAAGSERTQYGYDHPTDKRPGRAYFTLPSGRHFEATVTPLR
jgi:hypothetical protein